MRKAVFTSGRGGGVFKIYDAPESPNEVECLRYVMNGNRNFAWVLIVYGLLLSLLLLLLLLLL